MTVGMWMEHYYTNDVSAIKFTHSYTGGGAGDETKMIETE